MSAQHYYIVPILNKSFRSLEDAKWNLQVGLTRIEVIKYLGQREFISHYIGDKLHSITPIYVDEIGNISFGKPSRV